MLHGELRRGIRHLTAVAGRDEARGGVERDEVVARWLGRVDGERDEPRGEREDEPPRDARHAPPMFVSAMPR